MAINMYAVNGAEFDNIFEQGRGSLYIGIYAPNGQDIGQRYRKWGTHTGRNNAKAAATQITTAYDVGGDVSSFFSTGGSDCDCNCDSCDCYSCDGCDGDCDCDCDCDCDGCDGDCGD